MQKQITSYFHSDGEQIAYFDAGVGVPVILAHGFCSNYRVNWEFTGWSRHLMRAGFRPIMLDFRGHGGSSAPRDETRYRLAHMARDICRLMDTVEILRAPVIGFSMGSRIVTWLAAEHPERVDRLVLGGMGSAIYQGLPDAEEIAIALETDSPGDGVSETALGYRTFAETTNSDRFALAACVRGNRCAIDKSMMSEINVSTLVVCGSEDTVSGSAEELAAIMPNAIAMTIPRRNHMRTSGDARFMEAATSFLTKGSAP